VLVQAILAGGQVQKPDFVWQFRILGLLVLLVLVLGTLGIMLRSAEGPPDARLNAGSRTVVELDEPGVSAPDALNQRPGRQARRPDPNPSRSSLPASRADSSVSRAEPGEALDALGPESRARATETKQAEDRELEIAGTVFDDRGELVPGVPIEARPLEGPGGALQGRSDRLGMFSIAGLRQGDYELRVPASDAHHGLSQRLRAGTSGAELHLQRRLRARVEGNIRDHHGQALSGVAVRSLGGNGRVRSGALGEYAIEVEWARAGTAPVLSFEHPGYRVQRQRIAPPQAAEVALRLNVVLEPLNDPVMVAGQVNDRLGRPVASAQVWLSSTAPRAYRRVNADGFGRFAFEGIEPGPAYRLGVNARAPHAAAAIGPLAVGPGDGWVEIMLEVDERATLSGQVISPDGRIVPGMGLWVRRNGAGVQSGAGLWTDGRGRFEVASAPAGELWLESMALPHLSVHGLMLRPGEHRELLVPVDWGQGWLFGRVLAADSRPLPGARVSLHWNEAFGELLSVSRRETRTDSEGYFSFANLGARSYGLQVQAAGHPPWRQQVMAGFDEVVVVLPAGEDY
jgi:protocatechuate 3,4-dioxygenase beta subunit